MFGPLPNAPVYFSLFKVNQGEITLCFKGKLSFYCHMQEWGEESKQQGTTAGCH